MQLNKKEKCYKKSIVVKISHRQSSPIFCVRKIFLKLIHRHFLKVADFKLFQVDKRKEAFLKKLYEK